MAKEEEELQTQIQVATQLQQHRRRGHGGRARGHSDATDDTIAGGMGSPGGGGDYTPIETFDKELEVNRIRFNTVKLFHARPGSSSSFFVLLIILNAHISIVEGLGTTYLADPICDDINTSLPLELHTIAFNSPYYLTTQGRRKLNGSLEEMKPLTSVRHSNLVSVFAVKVVFHSAAPVGVDLGGVGAGVPPPPQLMILTERMPGLTLQDVLEDCAALREERASGYLSQILGALNALHLRGLVHRGRPLTPWSHSLSSLPYPRYQCEMYRSSPKFRLVDIVTKQGHQTREGRVSYTIAGFTSVESFWKLRFEFG